MKVRWLYPNANPYRISIAFTLFVCIMALIMRMAMCNVAGLLLYWLVGSASVGTYVVLSNVNRTAESLSETESCQLTYNLTAL